MVEMGEIQKAVYDFIREYKKENDISPTIREIGAAVFLHASVVHHHLCKLKEKGFIHFVPNAQRTIRILKQKGAAG